MEGVAVVDCEVSTVEKTPYTELPTLEKRIIVNPEETTKLRPDVLTLQYKINGPDSKIIPFLPKNPIQKSNGEPVQFGRTKTFDVFLNDECMSRNYASIYAERNDSSIFKVVNFSRNKAVILDDKELRHNEIGYIKDKSVLQLDIITFFISLQCGDKDSGGYVVKILPEIESNPQLCRPPSLNLGNCNLTCCHTSINLPPVIPQIYCHQSCLQIHNSLSCQQSCPQIHNSSSCQPSGLQIYNSLSCQQSCPQIHNTSNGTPICCQSNTSSNGIQVSHQIPNPLNYEPVSHVNKTQPTYLPPNQKGSSPRQPQEHSMPSEKAFFTEKQQQYQLIEDMSRKSSF